MFSPLGVVLIPFLEVNFPLPCSIFCLTSFPCQHCLHLQWSRFGCWHWILQRFWRLHSWCIYLCLFGARSSLQQGLCDTVWCDLSPEFRLLQYDMYIISTNCLVDVLFFRCCPSFWDVSRATTWNLAHGLTSWCLDWSLVSSTVTCQDPDKVVKEERQKAIVRLREIYTEQLKDVTEFLEVLKEQLHVISREVEWLHYLKQMELQLQVVIQFGMILPIIPNDLT